MSLSDTDVISTDEKLNLTQSDTQKWQLVIDDLKHLNLITGPGPDTIITLTKDNLLDFLQNMNIDEPLPCTISLNFNANLKFQDYISIKSELSNLKSDKIIIDLKESIY